MLHSPLYRINAQKVIRLSKTNGRPFKNYFLEMDVSPAGTETCNGLIGVPSDHSPR